jgi:hypothetical protein
LRRDDPGRHSAASGSDLRELACRQAALHRRTHPEGAIGGHLWGARVTRESIRMHDAGEIVEPVARPAFGVRVVAGGWAA